MYASGQCARPPRSGLVRPVPRAHKLRGQVVRPQLAICAAEGAQVRSIRMEIDSIQAEVLAVSEQARAAAKKRNELFDVISQLDKLATKCVMDGADDRAREIIKEKAAVMEQADQVARKIESILKLEAKLKQVESRKRAALLQEQESQGTMYEDRAAQVRVTVGADGKPRFERTGSVGQVPTFSSMDMAGTEPPASQYNRFSSSRESDAADSSQLRKAYSGSEFLSVDDMLDQSDRKLEDKFIELERLKLAARLREEGSYSSPASPSSQDGWPGTYSAPTTPPPAPYYPRPNSYESPWTSPSPPAEPPRVEESLSDSLSDSADPWGSRTSTRAVTAEWWTSGQNMLMEGALAALRERYQPMYADAGKALVAIVNARVRGQAPSAQQLLSLIALTIIAPSQHGSSTFWGVVQPPGAQSMPETVKLSVFGGALQIVIEDLLTGSDQMLTMEVSTRSPQAKALLVALASALNLRTSEASDYSVRLLLRTVRAALMNALVPLRLSASSYSGDAQVQAENDLRRLHTLLSALPCSLPIAVGHIAAAEVTEQLRKVMQPEDARRMDKLYSVISKGDHTGTTIRAILGPLFGDKY